MASTDVTWPQTLPQWVWHGLSGCGVGYVGVAWAVKVEETAVGI